MPLHYGRVYVWRGWRVFVPPGARIRRISDRGTLDARAVDVRSVERPALGWSVLVHELELPSPASGPPTVL